MNTIIFPPETPPDPPEGFFWKAYYHLGKLSCFKLTIKEHKKPCNCSKRL